MQGIPCDNSLVRVLFYKDEGRFGFSLRSRANNGTLRHPREEVYITIFRLTSIYLDGTNALQRLLLNRTTCLPNVSRYLCRQGL